MENQNLSKKPLFNLNKVLQETGVKADTLRAWERRYQLPNPSRTDGGHRLFSQYDIETIKWLQIRQSEGMRISQAVDYWRELISNGMDPLTSQNLQRVVEPSPPPTSNSRLPLDTLRFSWINHALNYEETEAVEILEAAFAQYPWEVVCQEMIFEGLSEIGERWYLGEITVQQEHYVSELVVRKLSALASAAPPSYHAQKVMISCPPGEFHIIPALTINTLLRYRGWEVDYLGANVPTDQLELALEKIQPTLVIMTAARLTTSAALFDTSQLLLEQGKLLAYGGNTFSEIPALRKMIPGIYLGTDISQAVSKIETLLSSLEPPPMNASTINPYLDLMKEFKEKMPLLENQALLAISADTLENLPHEDIREVNKSLFQDIWASLTFGDINLLHYNFDWSEGLIRVRSHNPKEFKVHIKSILELIEQILSNRALPLLEWMKDPFVKYE